MSRRISFSSFSFIGLLTRPAVVLLLPLVEFLILRFLFHSVFRIKIGWRLCTDQDLFIPVIVSFFLLFYVLQRERPLVLKLRRSGVLAHGLLLYLFVLMTVCCRFDQLPSWVYVLWSVVAILSFASSLIVLVAPSFFLNNPNRWAVVPCGLISLLIVLYNNSETYLAWTWNIVGQWTGSATYALLSAIFGNAIDFSVKGMSNLAISHASFYLAIGRRCGGLDSFLLFSILFLIILSCHRRFLRFFGWSSIFLAGLAVAFFANVLRIAILFTLGVVISKLGYSLLARQIVFGAFHAQLGWVLYACCFTLYLYVMFRLLNWKPFSGVRRLFVSPAATESSKPLVNRLDPSVP